MDGRSIGTSGAAWVQTRRRSVCLPESAWDRRFRRAASGLGTIRHLPLLTLVVRCSTSLLSNSVDTVSTARHATVSCSRVTSRKKGAGPEPLPRPPPRGTEEQPGRRPLRGAATRLLLQFQSRSSGWRFRGKQNLTLARRSSCIHGRAFRTAGSAKPSRSAVRLRTMLDGSWGRVAPLDNYLSTSIRPLPRGQFAGKWPGVSDRPCDSVSRKSPCSSLAPHMGPSPH